ncbi:MAG: AAA family ATPase [Rikenellaceae bacterium]
MLKTNSQIELAKEFLQTTGENIFLTGRAGTGKTTFLRNIITSINKRVVVAAPTAVAAINARGVTLHSLFQIPFGPLPPNIDNFDRSKSSNDHKYRAMSKNKIALLRSMQLLVIDEISMVRCDILDAIDKILRRVRHRDTPFGGVQLLMIGDIEQLSPICKDEEWLLLQKYYKSAYFFDSQVLSRSKYITIELKEVYRQSDTNFTSLLNAVRDNNITPDVISKLNSRYIPDFQPTESEGYITLTTHNFSANRINSDKLDVLANTSHYFKADVDGDYPEAAYPNDLNLELKVDAQVIFIKNDPSPEKLYYNGMIGKVKAISEDKITVMPTNGAEEIELSKITWDNIEYRVNEKSGEIEENIKGTFKQIPLRLAWAITIHKSQGLSFDRAIIDAESSFAHGQVYVALSRCRTFEGLVLKSELRTGSIIRDEKIEDFSSFVSHSQPSVLELERCKWDYHANLLYELFGFSNLNRLFFTISKYIDSTLYKDFPLICDSVKECSDVVNRDIFIVGENFKRQIEKAIAQSDEHPAENSFIKERLFKASQYFSQKFSYLDSIAEQISLIEPSAKDVKKRLSKYVDELEEELQLKSCGIELCGEGFTTDEYNRRKFRIMTQSVGSSKSKKSQETRRKEPISNEKIVTDIINEELYLTLTAWRTEMTKELDKPAYTVLTNRAIIELQAVLPTDIKELSKINGIGKIKLEEYGEELLDIICDYVDEQQINIQEYRKSDIWKKEVTESEKAKILKREYTTEGDKLVKIASHLVTLSLLKEGMSIEEIAAEREMSVNTIRNHIEKNIAEGALQLEDYIENYKIEPIRQQLSQQDETTTLSSIKEKLGEDYSYNDIRFVIAGNK